MAIPFASLKAAVRSEQRYTQLRDMCIELGRALGCKKSRASIGIDYDRAMEGRPLSDAASALITALGVDLPFDVYVSLKEGAIISIIKRGAGSSEVLQDCVRKIEKSAREGSSALIAFKMKHLGIFVCHTLDLPHSPSPKIVISSTQKGATDLTIETLDNFKKQFEIYGG